MQEGYLSDYFEKVASKRLTAVEVDSSKSHQHEFNGTRELKNLFGTETPDKRQFPTRFIWFGKDDQVISSDGLVTWYDARKEHPTRSEYRLYFQTSDVSQMAKAGDLLIIARRPDQSVMLIIADAGGSVERQLLWLFNINSSKDATFTFQNVADDSEKAVDFTVWFVLDELGVEVKELQEDYFDSLLEKYDGKFPTTREFSLLTRQSLKDIDPLEDPDEALMAWMNHEELLFRHLERKDVEKRIEVGFLNEKGIDVDGFVAFSLSVQNRRKSRAGLALENHLEDIFKRYQIRYDHTKETENRSKPDFLFPSISDYRDLNFPIENLTMLGVKTSCKDRWRQILSEAARIKGKHLFTLEPGISANQTAEMKGNQVTLVIPNSIHNTYLIEQQEVLMNLRDFISYVAQKQI